MKIAERHAAHKETKTKQDEAPKARPDPLTKDNLSKADALSQVQSISKKKNSQKPACAIIEKQKEDAKEAEIDDLLEYACELDYEKYMEDYQFRQALAIIKDRVNEITGQAGLK